MEFYEFFEKIVSFIPENFKNIREICEAVLPWLFGFFTLATSFVGHFMHKIWNIFFFFGIGFFVPLLIIFAVLKPTGAAFWTVVLICVAIGVLCAVYSHHLHKTKLFITTLLMVYIAVSGYIIALGNGVAILIGLAVAIVAAILSIKYKYIAVIVTTAFSGSMMFWNMIESKFNAPHTLTNILAIVMGALGLALQIYVERKELKESYNEIKETSKKVKKKIKKENENN